MRGCWVASQYGPDMAEKQHYDILAFVLYNCRFYFPFPPLRKKCHDVLCGLVMVGGGGGGGGVLCESFPEQL